MKTAEEWYSRIMKLPLLCKHESTARRATAELVSKIQLDAYRAGMTEAAAVCHRSIQPTGPYFKTLILAARDAKTTI